MAAIVNINTFDSWMCAKWHVQKCVDPCTGARRPGCPPPPKGKRRIPAVFLTVAVVSDVGFGGALVCAGREYAADTAPPACLEPAFNLGWRFNGVAAHPVDVAGPWSPIGDVNFVHGPLLGVSHFEHYPFFPYPFPPANDSFATAQGTMYPDGSAVPPLPGWTLDAEYHAQGLGIYLWSGIIPAGTESLDLSNTIVDNEQLFMQIYPVSDGGYIDSAENDGSNDLALPQDPASGYWIMECDVLGQKLSMCNQNSRGSRWLAASAAYGS